MASRASESPDQNPTLASVGDPQSTFEANSQALVFGMFGAAALLLTIVTRRGHGHHTHTV